MTDNSLPDSSGDQASDDSGVKIYVPASVIKDAQVGDSVDFQVTGTVNSLDGDIACVSPDKINGEPAPPAPADNSDDNLRAKMRSDAAAEDNAY